jgi:HEAT repeat protein
VPEGMFFFVATIVAFGAFLYRIGRSTLISKIWADAARAVGMGDVSCNGVVHPKMTGVADGFDVTVESDTRKKRRRTVIRISGAARLPQDLHLGREGIGTTIGKLFEGEDIQLGDEEFDRAVLLRGDPATSLALMAAETRGAVLRGVSYGSVLSRGELCREIDHEITNGTELENLLRSQLKLAGCLTPEHPVPDQLAINAREDPNPKVRLRNLEVLVASFPDSPVTRTAQRDALADLRSLAADPTKSDDLASRAVAAMGAAIPFDFCRALLDPAHIDAFPRRTLVAARAISRMADLAESDRRSRATALAGVLAAAHDELGAAAAEAIGATGDETDQPALIEALAHKYSPVREAAANGLKQIGTAAAVAPLHALVAASPLNLGLRILVADVIDAIKARLIGATEGQVALADGEAGQLAITDGTPGLLTLAEAERTSPASTGRTEEPSSAPARPRPRSHEHG